MTIHTDTMTIARCIEQLRLSKGLNQRDFAKKAGIPQSALSYFESGDRIPRIEMLGKIAKAFNTTISYLVGESDSLSGENLCKQYGPFAINIETFSERGHFQADLKEITVHDDAMQGIISKGSIALVNTTRRTPKKEKSVFAIQSGDNITFRYAKKELDGTFMLTAEDDEVKRIEVDSFEASEFQVLGELVASFTQFNWSEN